MDGFNLNAASDRLFKISEIRNSVLQRSGYDPGLKVASLALEKGHNNVADAVQLLLKDKLGLKRRKVTLEIISTNIISNESLMKKIKENSSVIDVVIEE